jgi:hypothetical protein
MYLKVFAALCISTCVDTEFSNYITEVLVKFNSEKEKEKKKTGSSQGFCSPQYTAGSSGERKTTAVIRP